MPEKANNKLHMYFDVCDYELRQRTREYAGSGNVEDIGGSIGRIVQSRLNAQDTWAGSKRIIFIESGMPGSEDHRHMATVTITVPEQHAEATEEGE